MSIKDDVLNVARAARAASFRLARLDTGAKNSALLKIAGELEKNAVFLKAENMKDLKAAESKGLTKAMLDRLTLSDKVIASMAAGLREVAALPDPVGGGSNIRKKAKGLRVGREWHPVS